MKHIHPKAILTKFLVVVLIVCMLYPVTAYALPYAMKWPSDGAFDGTGSLYTKTVITADEYPDAGDLCLYSEKDSLTTQNEDSILKPVVIPGLNSETATRDDYYLTLTISDKDGRAKTLRLDKANYYLPVRVTWTANDGRQCDLYIMAIPEFNDYNSEKYTEAHTSNANRIYNMRGEIQQLYSALSACDKGVVGGYQIESYRCFDTACASLGLMCGSFHLLADYTFRGYDRFIDGYLGTKHYADPTQTAYILDVVLPYYMDYCRRPIQLPEITDLRVANTAAVLTKARNYTITLPSGTDWSKVKSTMELTVNAPYVEKTSGAWQSGSYLMMQLYARDPATHVVYDNDNSGIVQNNYVLKLQTGIPAYSVSAFEINGRKASITEAANGANTIALHLAKDWSWTQKADITYTGSSYVFLDAEGNEVTADNGKVDFTKAKTLRLTLDLSEYAASGVDAEAMRFTKDYTLEFTQGNSAECDLLSFSVGVPEEKVVFEGTDITVTIPYATDWTDLRSSFTCSYDAVVTKPENEDFANSGKTPLTYLVTAEDGTTSKAYSVSVKKIPPATDNKMVAFEFGTLKGVIDHNKGTVKLELPSGSSTTLAPTITLPEFATVSPASGVAQDFTDPVKYTVTAQNGDSKEYVVTVTVAAQAADNPRKAAMQGLLDSIISSYRKKAYDDWEWLNLGLYDLKKGYTEPNAQDGFDIEYIISHRKLGPNGLMTDLDRVTLMLTARGYDCSNLAQYNDGKPFIDANGEEIDNLVANLCSTTVTLNGAMFGLLALDIGNYTLPEGTEHDREFLLEFLLDTTCDGVANGFMGLDGVGSVMFAIGPYQNDPDYGDRVKEWLQNGTQYIADQVRSDYTLWSWSTVNSEVISWSLCGLCSAGVDPYTDPRFGTSEKNIITQWLDIFSVTNGFKHIETETQSNQLATYEGCYALQWYLNFLEKGGNGHPYFLWYRQHDFSKTLSTEAKILSFELEGRQGEIHEAEEGSGEDNTITLELPKGTPLNSVTPQITLSEKAVLKAPELPTRLTAGTAYPFTVCAEDGKTERVYYVTVSYKDGLEAKGAELYTDTIILEDANQRKLEILNKTVKKTETGADILLNIDAGKNIKQLRVKADISYGATASPRLDGSFTMDLSDWMEVVIKAQDGTTKIYRLKAEAKQVASITGFALTAGGKTYQGTIDNEKNTITVSGVDDSALTTTKLAPDITLGSGTTVCSPTSGIAQDFSQEVTYIVSGTNVAARTYKVNVYNQSGKRISANGSTGGDDNDPVTPVTGAKITAFSVLGVEGVIDQSAGTITVTLPAGTNVTAVAPTFTATAGAVVSPVSGEVVNLTRPVVYTVTLGDMQTRYTVSVIYERFTSQQLWDKLGDVSDVTDHQTSHTKRNWS